MLRTAAIAFAIGLATVPAAAQGRDGNQGIPRGHMPPAGMCRAWYDNLPPGRQPPPVNCNDAERVASRDSNARVIYGTNSSYNNRRSDQYPGNGRYPDHTVPDWPFPTAAAADTNIKAFRSATDSTMATRRAVRTRRIATATIRRDTAAIDQPITSTTADPDPRTSIE